MDRLPEQVHIEVLIVEHSVGDGLDLGVEMAALEMPSGQNGTTVQGSSLLGDANSLLDTIQKGVFPRGLTVGVAHGRRVDASGREIPNYPAVLNVDALRKSNRFKLLSQTSLEAQNNREATVRVVNEIPILKSTVQGGAGASRDVIQNIERMDVGIKLKLKPHIIPGGEVQMVLNPSIEAVVDPGPPGTTFAPTIARREVSTTVSVRDGQTIVIAGLTREDEKSVERRVPVLGSVPLLGLLFRRTMEAREKTNVLILVTPHLVTEEASARSVLDAWKKRTGVQGHEEK
jgi:general secretion pathway protein D